MEKITLKGHTDDRGDLFWFGKEELGLDFKYVTTGTIHPGCVRGGHYHTKIEERIVCVYGALLVELDDKPTWLFPGDVITVPINTVHKVINAGETTAVFVELKSERIDKGDMDTYRRDE